MAELSLKEGAGVTLTTLADNGSNVFDVSTLVPGITEDPRIRDVKFVVYSVFVPIVCVVGIVGDVLNLIVLWRSGSLRSVSYVYMRWLAVADFFVMITSSAWFLVDHLQDALEFHDSVHMLRYRYKSVLFLINSFICASNLLVMAITLDRYLSVCHPISSQHLRSHERANIAVGTIYIIAFLISVPYVFANEVVVNPNFNESEWVSQPRHEVEDNILYKYVWTWVKESINKFIPILSVVILNMLILQTHRKTVQKRKQMKSAIKNNGTAKSRDEKQERRLAILLVSISVVFVVFSLPAAFVTILNRMYKTAKRKFGFRVYIILANLLELTNFAVNFYVYSGASADFRKNFREVFDCCKCTITNRWGQYRKTELNAERDMENTTVVQTVPASPQKMTPV